MKKKVILLAGSSLFAMIIILIIVLIIKNKDDTINNKNTLDNVKNTFQSDLQNLKDGKYNNLIYNDFEASIDNVEGIYNIEIIKDNTYQNNTYLENFKIMNNSIDDFFMEDFDKSYIVADFNISDNETIYVNYDDIEKVCIEDKYNMPKAEFLFGNNTSNGGYMVQIMENLNNAWYSRGELGDIHPSDYTKTYPYITCIRQVEDVKINLKDGEIKLSEMEGRVLDYLNGSFPLPLSKEISLGIGEVRILDNGDYDGVCFKVRRVYKGIPFEYGSNASSGIYIDKVDNDAGEISYAVSSYPDTMLSFGLVNGTVVETESVSEIISLDEALNSLSDKIGNNSTYDVYGVELVYRNCEIPEEQEDEIDDILRPMWKIITINQNDDKYTLFFVDVVTGEITERFEYYYD